MKIIKICRRLIGPLFRNNVVKKMRRKNRIKKISIISSNCIGGLLYHDLGLRFDSPTINLFFTAHDFVEFLSDLDKYLSLPLSDFRFFVRENGKGYYIAKLGNLDIHFVHYQTIEECISKWNDRKDRIDLKNLVVIFTDRNDLTFYDLRRFLSLPYKKIVYVSKKDYCLSKECIYIPGFEKQKSVPEMQKYADIFGHKYYEKYYDVVGWLNEK